MTSSVLSNARRAFWRPARTAATLTLLLLLVVTFGLAGCGPRENVAKTNAPANKDESKKAANSAPPTNLPPLSSLTPLPAVAWDTQLKTLDGKSFKLSEMKGKVLVLDLWATWCPPCRKGIPHLVKLSKDYESRGVEVVGLDIDPDNPDETPETVRAFADEFKINYKLAFIPRDFSLALMAGNNSIPQTFIITRDGRMLKRFVGFSEEQGTHEKIREAVEQALSYQ